MKVKNSNLLSLHDRLLNSFSHNKFVGKESILIGEGTRFKNCSIIIHGKNSKLIFGNNCCLNGLRVLIEGNNNNIIFEDNVTVNASVYQPTIINAVGGTSIYIGSNSLLSNNIEIHSSDYHGIYNEHGIRINPDRNIIIGNNVWIGLGCKILKGTIISDWTVVGAGSIVLNQFNEKNVILAGNPAKIVKRNVFWDRARDESISVPIEF